MKLPILYEDNHLIVVYKPGGVLTQGDKKREISLFDEVKTYLKEKYKKPGNIFLGLVHRLDRPVSGIVLFAKTSKGASRISEQFRNNTIKKIYHALILGKPRKNRGMLVNYIKKDRRKNKVMIYKSKKIGSQKAELFYEVIKSNKKYSLLKIQIKTGRPHQIRAQFSFIGCPIVGDIKYGAPFALADKSIALSATSLSFQLPTKKERKTITIPIPSNWEKYIIGG